MGGIRAQLHPRAWLDILTSGTGYDPDIRYLLEGITFGFKVVDHDASVDSYYCRNYGSCYTSSNFARLQSLIEAEVISGKLSLVYEQPKCIHSMGVIEKKDSQKIRPITDCSQPSGSSVNSYMCSVQNRFHYVTVDQVVNHIFERKCVFMSTIDLANAYRSVMIRPSDRSYFGLAFDGQFYVDNCLCFGSRSAPFIFNRITDAVCRYMRDKGVLCFNYLDDIICLSRDFDSGVNDQLDLIKTLRYLGFYVAWKKICSPTKVCVYLGIEIDTENMCLRLPDDRIRRMKKELRFWLGRRKATEKQLQILLGHLSHCSRIIQGSNLYMHFLFQKLSEARGKRKVKLSKEFHDDLSWWYNLAYNFNSVPLVNVNVRRSWIQLVTGSLPIITRGDRFDTQIEWPAVFISSQDEHCCVIMNEAGDDFVAYSQGEQMDLIDLFLPTDLVTDPIAGELASLWIYLYSHISLSNSTVDVYCMKKTTWLCLKKSRVKHDLLAMVLRQIFWWSMERNIKLQFWYYPTG